ncbi:MAG: hypothetical protein ACYCW6_03155 [Candidatus Xenobia bacterium]
MHTSQISLTVREAATILSLSAPRLRRILRGLYPGWQPDWQVPEWLVRELYERLKVQL